MRVSPTKKVLLVVTTTIAMLLAFASPASADTHSADTEGDITIQTNPPQVIPVGGEEEPHPCDPDEDFAVTASGSATAGDITVDLPGKFFFERPGSPGNFDQIELSLFFQSITYSGTSPNYTFSGQFGLSLDVVELNDSTCAKGELKCSFAAIFDVAGTFTGGPLDNIDPGDTATLNATTSTSGFPLTYISGDCDEYLSLNGVDVDMDLDLTFI